MVWRTEGKSDKTRKKLEIRENRKKKKKITLLRSNRKETGIDCQLTFHIKRKVWSKPFSSSEKHFWYLLWWSKNALHKRRPERIRLVAAKLVETILYSWQLGQNPIGAQNIGITAPVHQLISTLCQWEEIGGTDQCLSPRVFLCRCIYPGHLPSDCPGRTPPLCPPRNQNKTSHKCSNKLIPVWTKPI